MNTATLNTNDTIPLIGFGTWKLKGEEAYEAVKHALSTGYRHIDTATVYGNETEVGQAIADSGIERKELFVTTKLWNDDHDDPMAAIEKSLKKLQLEYVDLWLMHWPVKTRVDSYLKMEDIHRSGKAKAIGVSNFTQRHLTELLSKTTIVPAVNQVEFNPFLNQADLHIYCREQGIALEAYSPLTHANKLNDEAVVAMAEKYDKSAAQILLRWAIQKDIVVIPKSSNKERIAENFSVFDFEISTDDMEMMNSWNEDARYCGDPTDMP